MIDAVTIGATLTQAIKENPRRQRLRFVNNSDEDISICPGPDAVLGSGDILVAGGGAFSDMPDPTGYIYTGVYTAICASGGKVLSVTELEWS